MKERGICYGIVQPGKHDNTGIPMVNSGDILNSRPNQNIKFKVSKQLHNKYQRSTLHGGEVLMTLVGANFGQVATAPDYYRGFNCSRAVGVIPVVSDSEYVMYALQSPTVRHYMDNWANRTAQPTFNLGDVAQLPVAWPTEKIREGIRKVISDLDQKIQLNRQTNQTLEHIAQALFKSWFVDFEPTRAKIAAKQAGQDPERAAMAAISGKTVAELDQLDAAQLAQLKKTAALFPDGLVESELGEVPEGWYVKSLDAIAHYQNGLALQKFRPEDENNYLPVLKIAQLKKGFADGVEKASPNIKPSCIVENGDVVFSWSGSLVVDVWCGGKVALNQHLFKVTSDTYPKWFYYYWTKYHLEVFQQIAADKAVTMGHIKRSHLTEAKCAVPCNSVNSFGSIHSLLEQQIKLRLENVSLQDIRDTLLPKLLSGELSPTKTEAA